MPAFTDVAGVPEICGADLDDGGGVPGSDGGGGVPVVPVPLEDCDGPRMAALDPEPPQPASAATAIVMARVRSGDLE